MFVSCLVRRDCFRVRLGRVCFVVLTCCFVVSMFWCVVLVFYIPLLESRNRLLAIEELLAGVLGINILFQKISFHCFMYGIP